MSATRVVLHHLLPHQEISSAACRFFGDSRAHLVALKVTDLNGTSLDQAASEYRRALQAL